MSWVHTALPKLPPVYYMYSHSVFQISSWMSCQHLRFCSSISQLQTQFSVCIRMRNRFTRAAQQEIYLLIRVFSFSFKDEVKLDPVDSTVRYEMMKLCVYWVSIGHYEAVAVGNWWYWVSRGHLYRYILLKEEIWTGVTDALRTHSLTDRLWKIELLGSL